MGDDTIHELSALRIDADATHALRGSVLRPDRPAAEVVFDADDAPSTRHFGVFTSTDRAPISIGSIYHEDRGAALVPAEGDPHAGRSWRLRGMATAESFRRQGAGALVLAMCESHAALERGTLVWCNARIEAVTFYESAGWAIVSDEFDIPTVGPHVVMQRELH